MKKLIFIFCSVLLYSCATNKVFNDYDSICGNYYGKNKCAKYYLTIKNDTTFYLEIVPMTIGYDVFCYGKFNYITKNIVILKCNEGKSISDITYYLSTAYMPIRQRKVKILENHRLKIKVDDVVLEKTEETDSK